MMGHMAGSLRRGLLNLAALGMTAFLPSGPAVSAAEPVNNPSRYAAPMVEPSSADYVEFRAADIPAGQHQFDHPVRILGDLTTDNVTIEATHIQVIGDVRGVGIELYARSVRDRPEPGRQVASQVSDYTGTIFVQGDVAVINGRLGGLGTGRVFIEGTLASGQDSAAPGFRQDQNMVVADAVCIRENMLGDRTMLIGNTVEIGGRMNGNGIQITQPGRGVPPVAGQPAMFQPVYSALFIGGDITGKDHHIREMHDINHHGQDRSRNLTIEPPSGPINEAPSPGLRSCNIEGLVQVDTPEATKLAAASRPLRSLS